MPDSINNPQVEATSATSFEYTTKEGDTLKSLAEKYNTTIEQIKTLNGATDEDVKDDDIIPTGTKIKIPLDSNERRYEDSMGNEITFDSIVQNIITRGADSVANINTRLLGIPYQFLPTADARLSSNEDMGRLFCENIFAEAPIVTIMPGAADFLPDYREQEKEIFQNLFQGITEGDDHAQSTLDDLISEENEARYFGFKSDYSNYIKYVNLLCRTTAQMLGIGDCCPPGLTTPYKSFDWGNYKYFNNYTVTNGDSSNIFDNIGAEIDSTINGTHQYLSLYVDPSTSFSESTSNETAKSALEGKFDEMESKIKEYSFFADSMALGGAADTIKGYITSLMDGVASLAPENTFLNSLLSKGKQQIVYGSNLIFPEIWQDSQYNKSYSISTTFVSPYGDKESIYINCLVPMMHLLALALPKQTTANTYTSPFLVKMFSKGWFSCEMGMVDNIQIDKGPEESWSVDGLATTMKVTMSVKDLYSQLMISPSNKPFLFFSNNGMIEFLGATCGVDMSIPSIELKVKIAMAVFLNSVTDLPTNWYREIKESIYHDINSLFT
jgi:LysM repeat protein